MLTVQELDFISQMLDEVPLAGPQAKAIGSNVQVKCARLIQGIRQDALAKATEPKDVESESVPESEAEE